MLTPAPSSRVGPVLGTWIEDGPNRPTARSACRPRLARLARNLQLSAVVLSARFDDIGHTHVHLNEAQTAARSRILERIATGEYSSEQVACFCGRDDDVEIARRDRYGLPLQTWLCQACGLMRTNPRLDPPSLAKFYEDEYRNLYAAHGASVSELFANQKQRGTQYLKSLSSIMPTVNTVFELGCGAGGLLAPFAEAGKQVCGIDLGDSDYVRWGQSRGLDLLTGTATDLLEARGTADLVLCIHVLEHFSDLRAEIAQLRALIAPGGWLMLSVPGIHSIADTYRGDVLCYLQNAHNYHFTAATLTMVLESCGMHVGYADESVTCLAVPDEEVNFQPDTHATGVRAPDVGDGLEGQRVLRFLEQTERAYAQALNQQRKAG